MLTIIVTISISVVSFLVGIAVGKTLKLNELERLQQEGYLRIDYMIPDKDAQRIRNLIMSEPEDVGSDEGKWASKIRKGQVDSGLGDW